MICVGFTEYKRSWNMDIDNIRFIICFALSKIQSWMIVIIWWIIITHFISYIGSFTIWLPPLPQTPSYFSKSSWLPAFFSKSSQPDSLFHFQILLHPDSLSFPNPPTDSFFSKSSPTRLLFLCQILRWNCSHFSFSYIQNSTYFAISFNRFQLINCSIFLMLSEGLMWNFISSFIIWIKSITLIQPMGFSNLNVIPV